MTSKGTGTVSRNVLLAATVIGALAAPSGAAVFTVGADPACNASSIQLALVGAIFSAGPDEIRVARNQSYTDQLVHLTDWDPGTVGALTIAGGYDDCADSTPTGRTTIDGQAAQSTFEIDTTGVHESQVTLRDLEITGSGVRGVKVAGNSTVRLEACRVQYNGGGIDVEPGATVEVDPSSWVQYNRGGFGQGGGIRCWGGAVFLRGLVNHNLATDGGGLFAGSGCTVKLHDGAEIFENEAIDGGGLYAEGGSTVRRLGEPTNIEVAILANTATVDGGGVYATGAGTLVFLGHNVRVDGNRAGVRGGGIYVEQLAEVELNRSARECQDPVRCTTLEGNSVTASPTGAAAYAGAGGILDIKQTYIEWNSVPGGGIGSILHAEGPGASLYLEAVALWSNQADALLEGAEGAEIVVGYVTASGNTFGATPSRPIVLSSAAQGELRSSIFWPNSPVLAVLGGTLTVADCLIVSNPTGLPAGTWSVIDPLFRNAAGGDLHLLAASPAVDYCGEILFSLDEDGDHEPHGNDLAENPNGAPGMAGGVYDIGYDEVWHLFYDGFESGNTSAWSSTTP